MPPATFGIRTLVAGLAVALAILFPATPSASSTSTDGTSTTTWSITPADDAGPDDRTSVSHTPDPGASIVDWVAVENLGGEEARFLLTAADGFTTREGRFDMLPSGENSTGAGSWIQLPDHVTVGPGAVAVIPIQVTVPPNAIPGDHVAGIAASIITSRSDGAARVGIETRAGLQVALRVSGAIAPAVTVQLGDTSYEQKWNPFQPGKVTATALITNTGNTRLVVAGTLSAGEQRAPLSLSGRPHLTLLPGESQQIRVEVADVWPTFSVATRITLTARSSDLVDAEPELGPVTDESTTFAIPVPQLVLLTAVACLISSLARSKRRSRDKLSTMLAVAREDGRREARGGAGARV